MQYILRLVLVFGFDACPLIANENDRMLFSFDEAESATPSDKTDVN